MEIHRFTLSRLRNEEWLRFHTEYKGLATECGTDLLRIERIYPYYIERYNEADRLLELLGKSFVTAKTAAAEVQRDTLFRGLRDAVKSNLRILDAAKQDAAVKVYAVIKKYSSAILRGGRSAKTAAIDNLVQDLTNGEGGEDFSQEAQTLGLGKWVTDLDAANTAYKQSLADRAQEATTRPEIGRLQQVRLEMDHFYTNMINSIDMLLLAIETGKATGGDEEEEDPDSPPVEGRDAPALTPDEKVIAFAKALNSYITHYKSLLKGRRTRSEKKESDNDNMHD
jgi:hypothetical protein